MVDWVLIEEVLVIVEDAVVVMLMLQVVVTVVDLLALEYCCLPLSFYFSVLSFSYPCSEVWSKQLQNG